MSAEVTFFGSGFNFIGGSLTHPLRYRIPRSANNYFDIGVFPSGTNLSLTVLEKRFEIDAAGNFSVWFNIRNNTANDTWFFTEGVEIAS
jgi:hypothetical protein